MRSDASGSPGRRALIVLEGLEGGPMGGLCAERGRGQARGIIPVNQFLANAAKA